MRPKPKPVPIPIVIISVNTFCAKTLTIMHSEAKSAPAIVTARQPYLLTNDDEIGPEIDYIFSNDIK